MDISIVMGVMSNMFNKLLPLLEKTDERELLHDQFEAARDELYEKPKDANLVPARITADLCDVRIWKYKPDASVAIGYLASSDEKDRPGFHSGRDIRTSVIKEITVDLQGNTYIHTMNSVYRVSAANPITWAEKDDSIA